MLCYKPLNYANHQLVSKKLYDFAVNQTNVLRRAIFWNNIDCDQVLTAVPELQEVLDQYQLNKPYQAALLYSGTIQGNIHIDGGKDVRILWPVCNTEGSKTKWFDVDPEFIIPQKQKNAGWIVTKQEGHRVIDELEITEPIFFNSGIPHGIYCNPKYNRNQPRITFVMLFYPRINYLLDE